MQLTTIPTLALALASAGVALASSAFVAKDVYLRDIAPAQLERLTAFTDAHKATLTAEQSAFLSKAAVAVTTYDTASADQLRAEAETLFTAADLRFLATGKNTALQARAACQCSTRSDWCDNNTVCRLGHNGCSRVDGCGWLYLYKCDGLCVNP